MILSSTTSANTLVNSDRIVSTFVIVLMTGSGFLWCLSNSSLPAMEKVIVIYLRIALVSLQVNVRQFLLSDNHGSGHKFANE